MKIDVAIVAPAFVYIPLWIGLRKGFFQDEALDVAISVAGSATHDVTKRIEDGRSHIGIGTPEGVLLDATERLVIAAGHANRAALSLVAQSRFQRIEDLRGASLGVASLTEGTAFILRDILAKHGLTHGDYEIVEAGTHPVRWEALKAGSLDAALQLVPFNFMAAAAGFSLLGEASDYVPAYAFTTVNLRRDWAASEAPALEAFLRALARATAFVYDHPSDIRDEASAFTRLPTQLVDRALGVLVDGEVVARDLRLDHAGLEAVSDILRRAGTPALQSLESAVDLRWLERAQQGMARTL